MLLIAVAIMMMTTTMMVMVMAMKCTRTCRRRAARGKLGPGPLAGGPWVARAWALGRPPPHPQPRQLLQHVLQRRAWALRRPLGLIRTVWQLVCGVLVCFRVQ